MVDANIAVKWTVKEDDSHVANALLAEWRNQNKFMMAPYLYAYEISNILLKKVRKNVLTITGAQEAMTSLLDMEIEIRRPLDSKLNIRSLDIAYLFKLPASYDAHYLALAEREQCEFWTADERLYNSVKGQFSWVRLLSDHPYTATPA